MSHSETKSAELKTEETKEEVATSLDVEEEEKFVTVKFLDAEFRIKSKWAVLSTMFKTIIETNKDIETIDMPISGFKISGYIEEYLNHRQGLEAKLNIQRQNYLSKRLIRICEDKWEYNFINKLWECRQEYYRVLHIANYLGIDPLLKLIDIHRTIQNHNRSLEYRKSIGDHEFGTKNRNFNLEQV